MDMLLESAYQDKIVASWTVVSAAPGSRRASAGRRALQVNAE